MSKSLPPTLLVIPNLAPREESGVLQGAGKQQVPPFGRNDKGIGGMTRKHGSDAEGRLR